MSGGACNKALQAGLSILNFLIFTHILVECFDLIFHYVYFMNFDILSVYPSNFLIERVTFLEGSLCFMDLDLKRSLLKDCISSHPFFLTMF